LAAKKAKHAETTDALDDLESWGDRAFEWLESNLKTILGTAAACLVLAAGYGLWESTTSSGENAAADALAKARGEYLAAMGAAPGAIEVPELANPAAAAAIRREYAERFRAVGEEHAGTVGGAMAQLEQGNLTAESGDPEAALAVWRAALTELPASSPLAGILNQRLAQALEDSGDMEGAATAFAAAAANRAFPFRHWAMAEAARCYLEAGQPQQALALYSQLQAEAPDMALPDHLRTQLRELEAAEAG
jgi:tetratricopeptide (TPR) repeat protein